LAGIDTKRLREDRWLKICGDLATASKHFSLSSRRPITDKAFSTQGYGVGRYGFGGYGIGEESIVIILKDGTNIDCLELVQEVVATWERVFDIPNP
jgi:hypothetical protein